MSSSTRIRPKVKHSDLPCFVIPSFDDGYDSFYPFCRLPEPDNIYNTVKKFILSITIFPIKILIQITMLPLFTLVAILSTINYNPTNLTDLSVPLPFWRQILFKFVRWSGRVGTFVYGFDYFYFHGIKIKQYTYKDMKHKFNYTPPIHIAYDKNGKEIHPQCYVNISNHLGFADILWLLHAQNGAFLCKHAIKNVFGIGKIATAMQSLFVEKGKSTTQQLVKRLKFTEEFHKNSNCKGCSLCLSNMCVFPEGTTTNGNDLLMFRTGVFNAGVAIRPIVIKCKWNHCNTTWESIFFKNLAWKVMTEFSNNMEIVIGPPYVPNEREKMDSALYAFNMNVLMAQMMGVNNEGRKPNIFLLNRDMKVKAWHRHVQEGIGLNVVSEWAKDMSNRDGLIERYLDILKNDNRYEFDGINIGNVSDKSDDRKWEGNEYVFKEDKK